MKAEHLHSRIPHRLLCSRATQRVRSLDELGTPAPQRKTCSLVVHPERRAEALSSVGSLLRPQLRLDAQQLVVLGETLRAARRACLDLSGAEPDGEVGNVRVLSLSRAVRCHHAPASRLGVLDRLDGLGD